jgi:hypothetical protein
MCDELRIEVGTFNPWPQCRQPFECALKETCVNECSVVKCAVIYNGRCPWDEWSSNKDIA